jgi:hypothetical protein
MPTILGDRKMKKMSRFLLLGAMILVLITSACAAQDTTPTVSGTLETSTPFGAATDVTETAGAETATTGTAETTVETPTVSITDTAAVSTSTTQTAGTGTPGVPVTGLDILLIECQFCVDTTAHALLVLPDTATFEITSPEPTTTTSSTSAAVTTPNCTTVEVNNGKQVVLCSGPEMTPITLNICTNADTCTDFPVDLLACPLATQPTVATFTSTPEASNPAITNTPGGGGEATPTATLVISTPTP